MVMSPDDTHESINEKSFYGEHDNPSTHYLMNINSLNKPAALSLNRLPTLAEILANRTKLPVDIFTFYSFMRDIQHVPELVDFWFDLVAHLNLCKHYVKGLRDSVARRSAFEQLLTSGDAQLNSPDISGDLAYQGSPNHSTLDKSTNLKHQSLSSSILLGLITDEHILEETDSHRLSRFLRGDINLEQTDPKIKELIGKYNAEQEVKRRLVPDRENSPRFPPAPTGMYGSSAEPHDRRNTSKSYLLDDETALGHPATDYEYAQSLQPDQQMKLNSNINPALIEQLIKDSPFPEGNSFVTRDNLRDSSHNLLLTYFVEDSEKHLDLPPEMHAQIIRAIEVDGRDDPDVFRTVRVFIFNLLEQHHLPKFLNYTAIRNVNHSYIGRIVMGFFFCFAGFWISFCLVFLDYRKLLRPVILAPFIIGFYLLVLSIYLVDPVLACLGYSESFSSTHGSKRLLRVREKFIYKLLLKRSILVLLLLLFFAAILTIIFSLVPGHRL